MKLLNKLKNLFTLSEKEKQQIEEHQNKLNREDKLEKLFQSWPDREREETLLGTRAATLEITVYRIRVHYEDGETEVLEHEDSRRPHPGSIEDFCKTDWSGCSYKLNKDKELRFKSRRTKTYSSINRDKVVKTSIVGTRKRTCHFNYDLKKVETTESKGSREYKRHWRTCMTTSFEDFKDALDPDWTLDDLTEKQTKTFYKAENVEKIG